MDERFGIIVNYGIAIGTDSKRDMEEGIDGRLDIRFVVFVVFRKYVRIIGVDVGGNVVRKDRKRKVGNSVNFDDDSPISQGG